jgi:putative transposase
MCHTSSGVRTFFDWLKNVDSIALQSNVRNVADRFDRFFKKKNRFHLSKFVRIQFKAKQQGISTNLVIERNEIKLPSTDV